MISSIRDVMSEKSSRDSVVACFLGGDTSPYRSLPVSAFGSGFREYHRAQRVEVSALACKRLPMFSLLPPDLQLALLRLLPTFLLTEDEKARREKAIWRLK